MFNGNEESVNCVSISNDKFHIDYELDNAKLKNIKLMEKEIKKASKIETVKATIIEKYNSDTGLKLQALYINLNFLI